MKAECGALNGSVTVPVAVCCRLAAIHQGVADEEQGQHGHEADQALHVLCTLRGLVARRCPAMRTEGDQEGEEPKSESDEAFS